MSGQSTGCPADAAAVIRPAALVRHQHDRRVCAITKKLAAQGQIRQTGNLILPGFTAPKILWLQRHEPANFKRLRHVLLPHDYLNFHLTGNYFMEHGDASGTALMDVRQRRWSGAAVAAVDRNLADWLPPLSESHAAAGTLRAGLAQQYGVSPDVVVSAGGGDNMMGAIGTGNVSPGVISASFGTSGTIAHAAKPVVTRRAKSPRSAPRRGWLPLLCTMV